MSDQITTPAYHLLTADLDGEFGPFSDRDAFWQAVEKMARPLIVAEEHARLREQIEAIPVDGRFPTGERYAKNALEVLDEVLALLKADE